MKPQEFLARFALRHLKELPIERRPELLDAAADSLPELEAAFCRTTSAFLRGAEEHQMKLFEMLENADPGDGGNR